MPAPVAANVQDEAVHQHLRAQVTVEVGPALADHVRNVEIAQPSAAQLAGLGSFGRDPVVVTQLGFAAHRRHDHAALLVPGSAGQRQLDRFARGTNEQRAGAGRANRLAVDREQPVTRLHLRARHREGRAGARIGRFPGDDPGHRPAAVVIAIEVGSEQADRRGLPVPVAARTLPDVGVGGAKLAEGLPEQVGEVGRARDPVNQRAILGEDTRPVHSGHVRIPEVVRHPAACLVERVPP